MRVRVGSLEGGRVEGREREGEGEGEGERETERETERERWGEVGWEKERECVCICDSYHVQDRSSKNCVLVQSMEHSPAHTSV